MTEARPDHLAALLARLQEHEGDGPASRRLLEQAALEHPRDARILLLLGAERIHGKDVAGAESAYGAALRIAPRFHIARFQLGLLQLTSGRLADALSTWAPLDEIEETDPLRLFKDGLACLARDDFAESRRLLLEGIARNRQNPALNRDMQMVLDRLADLGGRGPQRTGDRAEDPAAPGEPETDSTETNAHFLVSSYRKSS